MARLNQLQTNLSYILLALSAWIFLGASVLAYSSPGSPTGFVNDFAEIIPDEQQNTLERLLIDFRDETSTEISVLTVSDLGGDSIEVYANEVFREWGIGSDDSNNGVLLLVAVDDRKVRIEVGYGLEGALPDITASNIIDAQILPSFREGDFPGGVASGVASIIDATRGEYSITAAEDVPGFFDVIGFLMFPAIYVLAFLARSKSFWLGGVLGGAIGGIFAMTGSTTGLIDPLLFIGAGTFGLLLDYILSKNYKALKASGKDTGWFGSSGGFGGGGGGFGGFGGGSSGGGGASGGW